MWAHQYLECSPDQNQSISSYMLVCEFISWYMNFGPFSCPSWGSRAIARSSYPPPPAKLEPPKSQPSDRHESAFWSSDRHPDRQKVMYKSPLCHWHRWAQKCANRPLFPIPIPVSAHPYRLRYAPILQMTFWERKFTFHCTEFALREERQERLLWGKYWGKRGK